MDFDLSSDQQALRDAAASLLDGMAGTDALRARVGTGAIVGTLPGAGAVPRGGAADAPHGYDGAVWSAMADQGWLAIELPEDEGGLGMGMVELAVLCEEIGRRLVAAPFLPTIVALGALCGAEARDDAATKDWREALGRRRRGGLRGRGAGGERPHGQRVGAGQTGRASAAGRRPSPSRPPPTSPWSWPPAASTGSICAARAGPRPLSAMDRTRELGVLAFDGTPALFLGGEEAAALVVDRAATLASAEMLGAADHVLAMTVQYAKDRVQFGKPIGSFQAVKHMLADALVDVEGMRSTAYYAAWCAAAGDPERSLSASMAKAWCSDASRRVMAAGLQVHGGIGFTWEHDMHLYLKRAQLDQVSYGDAAAHRDRIATLLRQRLESGQALS